MKTVQYFNQLILSSALLLLFFIPVTGLAQQPENQINILDQNISIYAEDEPLTDIIKKICTQFDLDYAYNAKLIEGKKVNLSISNKTVKEVFDKLMDDFYLIFEIDDNILVIRDYVPMSENIDYENLYKQPTLGFAFDNPRRKRMTIDFKLISNLIVIPVSINESDTMNFILDTGVKDPIITELTLVEELNLNFMKPIELRGLGSDQVTSAYQSADNTISLPGLSVQHQRINVIIDENFQISQILGMPVHGLIGFNLFKHYIVKVDYSSEQITLYNPQHFKYRNRKKDIVMPVHFIKNKPVIRSEIVQEDGSTVPVVLLVDTGASDALWLSTSADERIKIPEKNLYTYLGMGLGGELFGHKARVDGIWMGNDIIVEPIVAYPESNFINNIIVSEHRQGTIGGEILRRFTLFFDYYNKQIIFRPNSDFKDDFKYNMSGLEIINPIPGVPVYTVNNVMKGSPAWKAGIRRSDQIIGVNHRTHNELSLNDINLLLRSKEDKKIKMTYLREGEAMRTTFRLKKVF